MRLPNGTNWPDLDDGDDDRNGTSWILRYGTPTQSDLLKAAEYVTAYHALVRATQRRRNEVCRQLTEKK